MWKAAQRKEINFDKISVSHLAAINQNHKFSKHQHTKENFFLLANLNEINSQSLVQRAHKYTSNINKRANLWRQRTQVKTIDDEESRKVQS